MTAVIVLRAPRDNYNPGDNDFRYISRFRNDHSVKVKLTRDKAECEIHRPSLLPHPIHRCGSAGLVPLWKDDAHEGDGNAQEV